MLPFFGPKHSFRLQSVSEIDVDVSQIRARALIRFVLVGITIQVVSTQPHEKISKPDIKQL